MMSTSFSQRVRPIVSGALVEHVGLRVATGALRPKALVEHVGLRVAKGALRPKPLISVIVAVGALGFAGCGHKAHATSITAARDSAAAVTTVGSEGGNGLAAPAPVPATFDVADLAEKVKPVVVNITTMHAPPPGRPNPFGSFFGPRAPERQMARTALGTGFIISADGYVVTNAHVVEGADKVKVRLIDDREFEADIIGRDAQLDLALLKLKKVDGLPTAAMGNSDALRVGEYVVAVGNPFGLGHTVTLGIVSGKARSIDVGKYDNFIQTDASINPGNSGGPLFNGKGEVIGINTLIRAGANSVGFAIPIDTLKDVLPQLRDKGRVERGKLGLVFQSLTPDLAKALGLSSPKGALVSDVAPGGSADRAGIKQGDVITAVNGTVIVHGEELPRNVARHPPRTNIKVSLVRSGKPMDVTVNLDAFEDEDDNKPARRPGAESSSNQTELGVELSDMPSGGVRVERVTDPESELELGDVIVELNGAPVQDERGLDIALSKLPAGSKALVKVKRGQGTRFAAITVPSR